MSSSWPVAWLALFLILGVGCSLNAQATTSSQVTTPASTAPSGADSMLRAADLQADVAILRRAYETLHPGLLRYNTPAQIDAAFGALELEFRQDRTLAQAYLTFSVFAAKVKCGHTYPNFFNQTASVAAALFQGPRLPFYFRWLGDRMIVTRSFTADRRIRAGTEVLTINGIPVADILTRLKTVARADGNNDAKRVACLQVEGTSQYEAFDVYWPLFFPSCRGPARHLRLPRSNCARTMMLQVDEFIRRFLLHVLPNGFMRIRHFGFLANRSRKLKLDRCRALLGLEQPSLIGKKSTRQPMLEVTGFDPARCPACRVSTLVVLHQLPASEVRLVLRRHCGQNPIR